MNSRILLSAGVLGAALVVGVIVVAAGGGGDDGQKGPTKTVRAPLLLERSVQAETGRPELLVSLPQERLNTLETSGGEKSVLLRCVDGRGAQTVRQRHPWPLEVEAGFPPHVHQPILPRVLEGVRACRMTGNGIDFSARVRGRMPAAQ